ncbi:MAG: type II toxin-antitoxin system HicB family antitoxin [Methylococcaceae bacterium]
MRNYKAIIERYRDTGLYIGFIHGFQGAHTQAETLDKLNQNLREIVEMLLEDGERYWKPNYRHPKCRCGLNMGYLPLLNPSEVVALLEVLGFSELR